MAQEETIGTTSHGLLVQIRWLPEGGMVVRLLEPTDQYPTEYALIKRGESGGWFCKPRVDTTPSVVDVVDALDREYGDQKRAKEEREQQARVQLQRINQTYAKDFLELKAHYGE